MAVVVVGVPQAAWPNSPVLLRKATACTRVFPQISQRVYVVLACVVVCSAVFHSMFYAVGCYVAVWTDIIVLYHISDLTPDVSTESVLTVPCKKEDTPIKLP